MPERTVMIMAGGTGGHVYPALAVAEELRARGVGVLWLGTRNGLEARVVPEKQFTIEFIESVGVRGKGIMNALKAPFIMLQGVLQARRAIARIQPVSVLGMGGFVSVPGALACWLMRKPLIIQEQNAIAGTANRLLNRLATRHLQGFDGALRHGETTGNPVRHDIAALPARNSFQANNVQANSVQHNAAPLRLLVLGGSLGAKPINVVLPPSLKQLLPTRQIQVLHQTGKTTYEETLALYRAQGIAIDGEHVRVMPYIEDMASAYRWADLVLCRAGAMTIAELTCVGLPSILVPLPHAIDDHQNKNAEAVIQHGAALRLPQAEMTTDSLVNVLSSLHVDRARLQQMANCARRLGKPRAAQHVADICLQPGQAQVAHG